MDNEIFSDTGNCGRCGRELTDVISIDRGYGPVCYEKHLKAVADEEFQKNQLTIDESMEVGQND